MWELLQKLEKLGWKPYGKSISELTETEKNVRLLTSLSSGLWQFVCENGLVEIEYGKIREKYDETKDKVITFRNLLGEDNCKYRLIESALKDESELEQFLLSNIVIKDGE